MSIRVRRAGRGFVACGAVGLIVVMAAFLMSGCGGSGSDSDDSPTTSASSTVSSAPGSEAGSEGVLVATEILDTFDEIVGKVAGLAQGNPEPAVLKPQLEELYASYEPIMKELNTKYLALRDGDVVDWGACNTYLGENRGKHVFDKDTVLTDALRHYNLEVGDQEMVDLLSKGPVELLDVAVAQN